MASSAAAAAAHWGGVKKKEESAIFSPISPRYLQILVQFGSTITSHIAVISPGSSSVLELP